MIRETATSTPLSTGVSLPTMADSNQIQLSVNITEPFPALRVDRRRIGEALHHLMHNALKFTPENGRVRRGVEGLGLGLPLVKAIIQAHRGRVGATSEPGKGSNFYFALPLNLTSTDPVPVATNYHF